MGDTITDIGAFRVNQTKQINERLNTVSHFFYCILGKKMIKSILQLSIITGD